MIKKEKIKINQPGKILSGEHRDWYIYIQHDINESDSGYLILMVSSLDENCSEGYDGWVANLEELRLYFEGRKWSIEWLDKKYTSRFIREPDE